MAIKREIHGRAQATHLHSTVATLDDCWVKEMWMNSTLENQCEGLAPPETQGWIMTDLGEYSLTGKTKQCNRKYKKKPSIFSARRLQDQPMQLSKEWQKLWSKL
jgi:hypothetical protein